MSLYTFSIISAVIFVIIVVVMIYMFDKIEYRGGNNQSGEE